MDQTGWLFLATDGEVYRSTDNGLHWENHLFPSQLHNEVEPVTVLSAGVIVAETDFDNFVSTDRGESWNYLWEDVRGFAVDTNGDVYAGSHYRGVVKSTDGGSTWSTMALAGKAVWRAVICGGGRLVCPCDSGTYYSEDQGITWTYRPAVNIYTNWNLISDRQGHLFVISDFGLCRSNDFGSSWEQIELPVMEDVYRIYVLDDGLVYVITDGHIFASPDAGNSWNDVHFSAGMPLSVGHDASGNLLAGCFLGIFKRSPGTGEWMEMNNGLHARRIERIQCTPASSMLVLSLGTCFRSTDDGESWAGVSLGPHIMISPYAPIFCSQSGSIFLAVYLDDYSQCGIVRSTDDGITWNWMSVLGSYYALSGLTQGAGGAVLACSWYGDIYRSTDDGNSWARVVTGTSASGVITQGTAAEPSGNSYFAMDTSVIRSNNGIAWEEVSLRRNSPIWESMSIDARGEIFLGSCYNGVFHSTDHGTTWDLMNRGLPDRYVYSCASDDSGNVVIGSGAGVSRLADSADNWIWSSDGLPATFTMSVSISPQHFVYAGTQDFGMYRYSSALGKRNPPIVSPPSPPAQGAVTFQLFQNYPNPFNPETTIEYDLPRQSPVSLEIYDVLGRLVGILDHGVRAMGRHAIRLDATGWASGVYFFRLQHESGSLTRKLILLK